MPDIFETLFIVYGRAEGEASPADLARIGEHARGVRGLRNALALTPVEPRGEHPFAADGRGPLLVLQMDFDSPQDIDLAVAETGPLSQIVQVGDFPSLAGARVAAQRMIGRRFRVPDLLPDRMADLAPGAMPCTFLVDYPGTTADLAAWLDHYDAHHPQIMVRFPRIRGVETFRPAPGARNDLPCARLNSMQRNKVVFDTPQALLAALASPVMTEMRADAARFPPFEPRATHFAMATRSLLERDAASRPDDI